MARGGLILGAPEHASPTGEDAETLAPPSSPVGGSVIPPDSPSISGFEIKRLIGAGGMGWVYEAVQEHPRRSVALKVLTPSVPGTTTGSEHSPVWMVSSAARRLEYEAQLLARLHHPGIAQVYQAGVYSRAGADWPYFAMEYIEGALPITRFARQHNLSLRARLELFSHVCDAVEHAHQRGIIHRDLKPANILVDSQGHPRVIDFGVARAADADQFRVTLQTTAGQLVGTLQYMSPEQVSGQLDPAALDARSDVFSLGVILFELVHGRPPWPVADLAVGEAIRRICESPAPFPDDAPSDARGDLHRLIQAALQKDPALRLRSAGELAENLRHVLRDEALTIRKADILYIAATRVRAAMHRHRALPLVVITLLAAMLASAIGGRVFFQWTGVNRWFESMVLGTADAPRALENVAVIGLRPESDSAALSRAAAIPDFNPDDIEHRRRLHAALCRRLAGLGPRVVTFDIAFIDDTPADEDLVAAFRELQSRGTDVVVGTETWRTDADGFPDFNRRIAAAAKWGCMSVDFGPAAAWRVDLAVKRGERPAMPSLSLASACAWRCPLAESVVELDPDRIEARANFYFPPSDQRPLRREAHEPVRIRLSRIEPAGFPDPAFAVSADDLLGYFILDLPPKQSLEQGVIDFAAAMTMPVEQLDRRCRGKVVLVANFGDKSDEHELPSGGTLFGCLGQAVAIDMLIREIGVRITTATDSWGWTIAGAALGAFAAAAWRSGPRRIFMSLVLMAALIAGSVVLAFSWRYVVNPAIPLLALLLSLAGGGWFLRRFHPVPVG